MKKKPGNQLNQNEFDGLVWIIRGRIFVKNEVAAGMPPLINPCEEVKLYINGILCNHLTTVSEKDVLEIEGTEVDLDFRLDVEVSEDKLKAYAYYVPAKRVKNVIVDTYPVNKLDVEVTQLTLETKKIKMDSLRSLLNQKGIKHGILNDELEKICESIEPGRFLIAEGTAPQDPTDDEIEYYYSGNDTIEYTFKENEFGNVDYRNISHIISVNPGQAIAQLNKGEPGKDGIAVTGEIIKTGRRRELTIIPSFSVSYDEKTGTIKANKPGRPFMQEKGDSIVFQVYDIISIDEVSMKTGNIRFKGDIEVVNNVYESMEVVARQNVIVKGNVNFSSIYAGNNITIKGAVISSKINAAMNDVVAKDPAPLMEKLIDGINRLIVHINGFSTKEKAEKQLESLSDILRYILNGPCKDLPNTVYDVINTLRKGNYDIEDDFILTLMKKTRSLMGNYSQIPDVQFLHQAVSDLRSLFSSKSNVVVKGNVILNSVTNSEVFALGNITITGKGSVNSKIFSNGKVTVSGYVRGGQIRAEKGIEINTAGSERGSRILLAVPEASYIQIRSVFTDTTIKVGGISHTFLSEKKMVRARLENGKLVF